MEEGFAEHYALFLGGLGIERIIFLSVKSSRLIPEACVAWDVSADAWTTDGVALNASDDFSVTCSIWLQLSKMRGFQDMRDLFKGVGMTKIIAD